MPTAGAVDAAAVSGRVAVVIDVLRASSTVAAALAHGAAAVVPVAAVEDARRYAGETGALLAGERGGLPPPGFALGNSPREYTRAVVQGRSIVLTTTNGTAAVSRCGAATATVLCAFANLSAVVQWLRREGRGVAVVCAGSPSGPAEEDDLCAGMLVQELGGAGPGVAEARAMAAREPDVAAALRRARHGRYLTTLGLADDVAWCARRDRYRVVPYLGADGRITMVNGA